LNILLFAHGQAGALALRELIAVGHHVAGCVTGEACQPWEPSLVEACSRVDVRCWTDPTSVNGVAAIGNRPDVVLSVGYRRRIEMPFLGLGRIGAFNVAGSQLPRYRGYFPFRWAILNGETSWGVTVHQMTPRYCDGAVLHRRPLVVRPNENAFGFYDRWSRAMAGAAVEAMAKLASGVYGLCSVEAASPLLFGPGAPHDGAIDWSQPAGRIDAFVRALDFGRETRGGYEHLTPPARARIGGREIGIWRSRFGGTMSDYPAGTVTRCDDQVWVQCGRGHLVIERLRAADGEDYEATDYFRTRGLRAGDEFEACGGEWTPPGKVHAHFGREVSHAA
jgi:methionyl-tRNA formyltransferase